MNTTTPVIADTILAQAFANRQLLTHARRLTRALPPACTDTLSMRVAIEADAKTTCLSDFDKACLTEMMIAHQTKWLPLPKSTDRYPVTRWESLSHRVLHHPVVIDLEKQASRSFHQLTVEFGETLIHRILANHPIYFARNQVLDKLNTYPFKCGGDETRWPHTAATLFNLFTQAVSRVQHESFPLLALLSSAEIYRQNHDPQALVEQFRDHDHSYANRILHYVHAVPFGHRNDANGRIHVDQIWHDASIEDVYLAHNRAERAMSERYESHMAERRQHIEDLKSLINQHGTHPATITRVLKSNNSALQLRSGSQNRNRVPTILLGAAGSISGKDHYLESLLIRVRDTPTEKLI